MTTPSVVLLDIEGTTTPISFVYDTLFPYAREHVGNFLREHRDRDDVRTDLEQIASQARRDAAAGDDVETFGADDVEAAIRNVHWQMDNDRKTTGLKSLQGKIWRAGYADGSLLGEVFDDVPEVFERLHDEGPRICIYSSGSIAAQKLLFGSSTAGDLTRHLEDYFDTTTGPKKVASSYVAIAESLDVPPEEILFCTDNLDEARAAREAGVEAVILDRPGNHPLEDHDFEVWEDLKPLLERV